MNKGYSLHIGLNSVDPESEEYDGWEGKLDGPETDALAMLEIAKNLNYTESRLLLTEAATRHAFFENVEAIREKLKPGDLFLLTFAGHGGQVPDKNGDEMDGLDETWCMYDAQVIDDEIYELLQTFEEGIRVLLVSDSSFSGDILRSGDSKPDEWGGRGRSQRIELPGVRASVRFLSSSQEWETSKEVNGRGLFSTVLLEVWNDGYFEGNYEDFYEAIISEIPFNAGQTPNYLVGGALDEEFDNSKPFAINSLSIGLKLQKAKIENSIIIEIILDKDFDLFLRPDAENYLQVIRDKFELVYPLKLKNIVKGSVRLTIEMNLEDLKKLIDILVKEKKYKFLGIKEISLKDFAKTESLNVPIVKGKMDLMEFKEKLKKMLAEQGFEVAAYELTQYIKPKSPKWNELILLKSRFVTVEKMYLAKRISLDDYELRINNVNPLVLRYKSKRIS